MCDKMLANIRLLTTEITNYNMLIKQLGEEAQCLSQRLINEWGESKEMECIYEIAVKSTNCMTVSEP